jgi:small ligand-binding sensory domain FIST
MKESYSEVLAGHADPESYADGGNTVGVATTGVHAGPVLSSVNRFISRADVVQTAEGNIASSANGKPEVNVAESKTWCMCGNSKRENREIPSVCWRKSPVAVRELHWR